MLCCLHYFSNRSFSFFPLPVRGSRHPAVLPPSPFCLSQCVSPLLSLSSLSSIRLLPLSSVLVSSLYRTPNVSSNGNPGYESLPLTDRQSPPPSVSSSVPVTPSHSVPFFSLLLVLTLALITSSKQTNVVHFYFDGLKPLKSAKHIRKYICPFWNKNYQRWEKKWTKSNLQGFSGYFKGHRKVSGLWYCQRHCMTLIASPPHMWPPEHLYLSRMTRRCRLRCHKNLLSDLDHDKLVMLSSFTIFWQGFSLSYRAHRVQTCNLYHHITLL